MLDLDKMIELMIKEKIASMSLREILNEFSSEKTLSVVDIKEVVEKESQKDEAYFPVKFRISDYKDEIKKWIDEGLTVSQISKKLPASVNVGGNYANLRYFISHNLKMSVKSSYEFRKKQADKGKNVQLRINPNQTSLAILDITNHTREQLNAHKIHMISDLIKLHPTDLLKIPGVGETKVNEIFNQLADYGLTFNYSKVDSVNIQ